MVVASISNIHDIKKDGNTVVLFYSNTDAEELKKIHEILDILEQFSTTAECKKLNISKCLINDVHHSEILRELLIDEVPAIVYLEKGAKREEQIGFWQMDDFDPIEALKSDLHRWASLP